MDVASYLWLIPLLPLAASALTAFFGPKLLRGQSHWPCLIGAFAACALSFAVLVSVAGGYYHIGLYQTIPWFQTGDVSVAFSFQADGLTALMLVTVTFVGSLIAVYSVGYMRGDPGYARYFAEISLFLFAMTGLVLADNFVLLYACWEGVGLCSYLLIGFWFRRPSAAAAARKAFLVTRIGDIGLLLGILLLWSKTGSVTYAAAFDWAAATTEYGTLTVACLLLFCGAVGKSAQFPLHVWLPDAMEGPSPVSALIHAATMVTAGVYLVARTIPLFALAPTAQLVVACIGGFTALLAALMALTQTDLKRVLAYSTISQLGYMFLALGSAVLPDLSAQRAGQGDPAQILAHVRDHGLVTIGVTAAVFHLFTHAFFKALLFLAAGSVMHAMGDIIDMRRFSGLRRLLPYTHWTFLCGAAALAGLPIFAGFWSKDEILLVAWRAGVTPSLTGLIYFVLFLVALITSFLTACYTFRAYFLTFWGEEKIPAEAGGHAHESPWVMLAPLMILAAGAVGVGLVFGFPANHLLGRLLHYDWMTRAFGYLLPTEEHAHGMDPTVMAAGAIAALAGVGLAWWIYVKQAGRAAEIARRIGPLYEFSRNRFYLDEIYSAFIVKPLAVWGHFCRLFDQNIVDHLVDLAGNSTAVIGRLFSFIQNGLVQFYALLMILGLAGLLLSMLLR